MASGPRAPAVALHGIVKRYAGVTALADIDLEIEAGSVHALVGENGAGKSTLGEHHQRGRSSRQRDADGRR